MKWPKTLIFLPKCEFSPNLVTLIVKQLKKFKKLKCASSLPPEISKTLSGQRIWKNLILRLLSLVWRRRGGVGVSAVQCDQIGLFLKGLGEEFSFKSSPNIRQLLAYFKRISLKCRLKLLSFGPYFLKKLGYFLSQYLLTLVAVAKWQRIIPGS